MPQRLSARKYIFNNKRRVSVLFFSMALCCVLFYVTNFLLSVTIETYGYILVKQTQKAQFIQLSSEDLGIDVENLEYEEWLVQYKAENEKLVEKLKNVNGIENAYFSTMRYAEVFSVVGQYAIEVPMLNRESVLEYMKHSHLCICSHIAGGGDGCYRQCGICRNVYPQKAGICHIQGYRYWKTRSYR